MDKIFILLATACYFGQMTMYTWFGNYWAALIMFGYIVANVGIIMLGKQ